MGKQTAGTATAKGRRDRQIWYCRVFTEKYRKLLGNFSEPQYYATLKIPNKARGKPSAIPIGRHLPP